MNAQRINILNAYFKCLKSSGFRKMQINENCGNFGNSEFESAFFGVKKPFLHK